MADRETKEKKGAGCFTQLLLGLLAGIAALLAIAFFLSSGPRDAEEGYSTADDAAANAAQEELAGEAPPAGSIPAPAAPAAKAPETPVVPRPADAGLDPSSDDQIADDAAAAGMTSRTPSPPPE